MKTITVVRFFAAGQLKNAGHTSTLALLPQDCAGRLCQANIKVCLRTLASSYVGLTYLLPGL